MDKSSRRTLQYFAVPAILFSSMQIAGYVGDRMIEARGGVIVEQNPFMKRILWDDNADGKTDREEYRSITRYGIPIGGIKYFNE